MVHANMTALLPQVYSGRISSTQTKLDEFGGSKMDAKVVAGIKIAGIEQVSFIISTVDSGCVVFFPSLHCNLSLGIFAIRISSFHSSSSDVS